MTKLITWWDGCIPDISSGWFAPTFFPLSREAQATPLAVGRSVFSRFAPAQSESGVGMENKSEMEGEGESEGCWFHKVYKYMRVRANI